MILWETSSFAKLRTIPTFESIETFQLVADQNSSHVITMGNAGLLKLWNVETGRLVLAQPQSQSLKTVRPDATAADSELDSCIVQSARVVATNTLILVTVDDSIVFVRLDQSLLPRLSTAELLVNSPDQERFFHTYKQFIGNHGDILDLEFVDVNERLLAVATNSPDIKIYDLSNWDCKILKGHTDLVLCLAAYKDRAKKRCFLASSSKDNEIRLWQIRPSDDSESTNALSEYRFELMQVCRGHTQDVGALSFSKQSLAFLVSGSIDTTIKLWRVDQTNKVTKSALSNLKLDVGFTVKAHDKDINCVSTSPNDKLIASGSSDRTAKVCCF